MYNNNIMSNLTELKEEDIVIKSLTEFTTKLQDRDVSIILNKFKNSKNINDTDSYGWNFLMWASRKGDLDIVKLLVDSSIELLRIKISIIEKEEEKKEEEIKYCCFLF